MNDNIPESLTVTRHQNALTVQHFEKVLIAASYVVTYYLLQKKIMANDMATVEVVRQNTGCAPPFP